MIVEEPWWQILKIPLLCKKIISSNANIKMIKNYGRLCLGSHPNGVNGFAGFYCFGNIMQKMVRYSSTGVLFHQTSPK